MRKKLTRHGNSWALVIDKPVLDLLKIDPEAPLEITTDGKILIIAPAPREEGKARYRAAMKTTSRKYGNAMKKLAE